MQMPDVNILVYAHRREDPNHEFYRSWVENLANGKEPFALSALVAVMIGSLGLIFGTLFGQPMREFLPYLAVGLVVWNFMSAS
jgi:hypothetical protein